MSELCSVRTRSMGHSQAIFFCSLTLAKERKSSLVPISKSPFEKSEFEEDHDESEHGELGEVVSPLGLIDDRYSDGRQDIRDDELQVYVTEVPWSDLVSFITISLLSF